MSAADAMTVVVAMNAVVAIAVTVMTAAVIAPRARMAHHPSRVSQGEIVLHVSLEPIAHRVSPEPIVHHVNHALKVKNSVSHVHRVSPALRVQIVQTCANHAKAMHQQRLHKLWWMGKLQLNNVSHANAAAVTAMVVIAEVNVAQKVATSLQAKTRKACKRLLPSMRQHPCPPFQLQHLCSVLWRKRK